MIDQNDKATLDAFGKVRRGRPPTGKAMSAAERKAAQRQRDRERMFAEDSSSWKEMTVAGLIETLPAAVSSGNIEWVRAVHRELERRTEINRNSHAK